MKYRIIASKPSESVSTKCSKSNSQASQHVGIWTCGFFIYCSSAHHRKTRLRSICSRNCCDVLVRLDAWSSHLRELTPPMFTGRHWNWTTSLLQCCFHFRHPRLVERTNVVVFVVIATMSLLLYLS